MGCCGGEGREVEVFKEEKEEKLELNWKERRGKQLECVFEFDLNYRTFVESAWTGLGL